MALDLVIENGTVIDGSGGPRYRADVGVKAGRIVEIGRIRSTATERIDAEGHIVSPGFIDGHTHMDAQVAWDQLGSCSCWHGVTSVVMGNCGFALAPCQPEEREWIARCLEAVEDIPVEAMMNGIDWTWETFPDYLDQVAQLPKAINYSAFIGHSALRMYVMGQRALSEVANEDDLRNMGAAMTPMNSFLIMQGIETLGLRMDRICENTLAVAKHLKDHPQVEWVRYAGLDDSPHKALLDKYMGGRGSGVMSFGVKGGAEAAPKFIDALQLITRLVNIGDAKSLACHPASTTHRQLAPEELASSGVTEDLIRLSIGIEHIDDILADVDQALDATK